MLRLQMSMLRRRMGLQLKNGKSFTHLIWRSKPKDWTKSLDSRLRNHSSLSQRCGWIELFNAMVLLIWDSIHWIQTTKLNNSSLMIRLRPFNLGNGRITLWLFQAMVDQIFSRCKVQMQDGSNSSDGKATNLSMITERSCPFKVVLMLKTDRSLLRTRMIISSRLGT
jgi:hypothetical protein